MPGSMESRDASLRFPSVQATWRGVLRVGVTAASQAIPLAEDIRGKFVRAAYAGPAGSDVQTASGISTSVLTRNPASLPLTPSAASGLTLGVGDKVEGILDGNDTHLILIGSAAGGFLELFVSEVL